MWWDIDIRTPNKSLSVHRSVKEEESGQRVRHGSTLYVQSGIDLHEDRHRCGAREYRLTGVLGRTC